MPRRTTKSKPAEVVTSQAASWAAFRAGNPDYNISLEDAYAFRRKLAALGMNIEQLGAQSTVAGFGVAPFIPEEELRQMNAPLDLPMHLECRFAGSNNTFHSIGLLHKMLRPADVFAFRQLFQVVNPSGVDQFNRSATDHILSIDSVAAAVKSHLQKAT